MILQDYYSYELTILMLMVILNTEDNTNITIYNGDELFRGSNFNKRSGKMMETT